MMVGKHDYSVSGGRWKSAQRKHENDARRTSALYLKQEKEGLPFVPEFDYQYFSTAPEFFRGKGILEVGCRPIAVIHGLREARSRVGLDPLAGQLARFYRYDTGIIQGRGESLPFRSATLDVVLCLNTLDHTESPAMVLREIGRVLNEGGTLVLEVHTFSVLKLLRRVANLIDRPHPHHLRDKEVLFMLGDSGYHIDYHYCRKSRLSDIPSILKRGEVFSTLKYLVAHILFGVCDTIIRASKVNP